MKYTLNQIAALLGAEVEGDGNAEVWDIARIEEGRPGSLSFYANPRYEPYVYETEATAVLVPRDFNPSREYRTNLLRVEDPYSAFTHLLEMVQTAQSAGSQRQGQEQPSYVHPDAEVHESAWIAAFAYVGAGVKVGPKAQIHPHVWLGDKAEVGEGSTLYSGVKLYPGCRVGADCILHAGAVIGSDGFGFAPQEDGSLKKIPQTGIVVLGDGVEIGANTTVDRATLGETLIESGVKLDNLVQVAHNVVLGENTVVAAQSGISGSTKLGRNCMIGGQVGIVGHIQLADRTQVGAQSGVSKNVKEEGKALRGSPAQDYRSQLRVEAAMRNLPELTKRVNRIEESMEQGESE